MKFKFVIWFFISFQLAAIDSDSSYLKLSFEYNRLDFFSALSFGKIKNKSQHEIGLGLGINKTFFQKRLNPEIQFRASYFVIQKKYLQIGLSSAYHFSYLNINKKNNDFHFYNEGLIGILIEIGDKTIFQLNPEIGIITESFRSGITKKYQTFYTFQYVAQIALKYGF
jgi:hypothetical protein